ncbi:putative purine phosphorylase [Cotonvirus japonicus]|uniref:Purine phosphorylase n=1 Tax=Cotonvirus japonicus TaxID=2811091 RepID=A0ABM7NR89_9VIRU|nr:putative purine phosphorylase [Cotonvirus japonicus]BCS82664.1 putative purine phosphorylase [Cotonvirus japonicus]
MQKPYITPKKLLGKSQLPIDVDLAFICYCPQPIIFDKYKLNVEFNNRLFIHTHNSHVMFCEYENIKFIVVSEVYGGPVSVTTAEELKFYGINTIIGIGFVGSFSSDIETGTIITAERSRIERGTTPHYTIKNYYVTPNPEMLSKFQGIGTKTCVWTTNALYREYQSNIVNAINDGCQVVNMDTSHLYAACDLLDIKCVYFATVSDYINIDGSETEPESISNDKWTNDLIQAINDSESIVIKSQTILIESLLKRWNDNKN